MAPRTRSVGARRRSKGSAVPDLMVALREAEIRARIRRAREEAGLTRDQLADLLTVHWRTVENYEKKTTPWALLDKIAAVTGKRVEWLLHGDDVEAVASNGDRLERIERAIQENHELLTAVGDAIADQKLDELRRRLEALRSREAEDEDRSGGEADQPPGG